MKNILYNLGMIAIVGIAIVIVVVTFWLVYPYNILEFKEGNGTIITSTVKRGGYLLMRQNSCKRKPLTSTISRQFIDGILYQVPMSHNNRPVGCYDIVEQVYIPKVLSAGDYHLITVISFKPNPLRTISYTVETGTFTITNGDE